MRSTLDKNSLLISEGGGELTSRKDVSEKLRTCRENCALSQRQVAEALNIERSTYTKYETGSTEPSLAMLVKLAAIYNVSPTELLPNYEESEKRVFRDSAHSDSPIYQLSKDERGLVALYRGLTKEEKRQAIELLANFPKNSAK